jgi:hypothetical protein
MVRASCWRASGGPAASGWTAEFEVLQRYPHQRLRVAYRPDDLRSGADRRRLVLVVAVDGDVQDLDGAEGGAQAAKGLVQLGINLGTRP